MEVQVKKIFGSWNLGYAMHKHTISSSYIGDDEYGHPRFETKRSEPGEALFKLKYRGDWSQVNILAAQIRATILPLFNQIELIIPMPASTVRARQPVNELASAVGALAGIPVFDNIVTKDTAVPGGTALKNLHTRAEKDAALDGKFSINPSISNEGCWNALLLDDLFDTGATMDAVCRSLRTYHKINQIYVAAITWK